MTLITADRTIATSLSPPSTPRLRIEPTHSDRTLLNGGWWPRSTDPVAELPGLILAIDAIRGSVTRLILSADGWSSHPRRLEVAGRVLRVGYFTSQPANLFTAMRNNGDRVDLLVVPWDTDRATAEAAMVVAATAGNLVHADQILADQILADQILPAAGTPLPPEAGDREGLWESEGGHL